MYGSGVDAIMIGGSLLIFFFFFGLLRILVAFEIAVLA